MPPRAVKSRSSKRRRPNLSDQLFAAVDGTLVAGSGRRWRIELLGIHTDGTTFWVQCVAVNTRAGSRPLTLAFPALTIAEAVSSLKAAIRTALR